jgi:hypothetical protein
MIKQGIGLLLMACSLSGCIGTYVVGREVDTTKPHPTLHSVPDRPKPIDMKAVEAERQDIDADYQKKLQRNVSIRATNKPPEKPETE